MAQQVHTIVDISTANDEKHASTSYFPGCDQCISIASEYTYTEQRCFTTLVILVISSMLKVLQSKLSTAATLGSE